MSNNRNNLAKTLEHNQELQKKSVAKQYTPKGRQDEVIQGAKSYAQRKGSMDNLFKAPPAVLTTLSKSTREGTENLDELDAEKRMRDWSGKFKNIHERIICKEENNRKIIAIFPELETAIEIIIASILSPNKMTDVQLNYGFKKSIEINDEVTVTDFMKVISEYMEEKYELTDKLFNIALDMLLRSGSSPHLILAESVVDDIINSDIVSKISIEEFKAKADYLIDEFISPIGILSIEEHKVELNKEEVTPQNFVEHLVNNNSLRITDNHGVIAFNNIKKKVRDGLVNSQLRRRGRISTETHEKIGYLDFFRDRNDNKEDQPFVEVKDRDDVERKTIGPPMVKKIPAASVFPITEPGVPDVHLGYFVFLDSNGNPVSKGTSDEVFEGVDSRLHMTNGYNNSPITAVYQDLVGDKNCGVDVDGIYEMFTELMMKKLSDTFKDSFYGDNVTVGNQDLFYYLLFTRALAADKTTLLFVPYDNLVYFSLLEDNLGIGKTLLDDTEIVSSMRAMIRFARVMAQVRNAIDITKVRTTLDPNDVDPEATMMKIQTDVLKSKADDFPLGDFDSHRLASWIRTAGYNFEWSGHPDVPDMTVEFEKGGMRYEAPDSELEEDLSEKQLNKIGLPAEVLSNAYNADFAAEILQRSVMYARRNALYQAAYEKDITKYVRLIIWNDGDLREKLKVTIKENKGVIEETLSIDNKTLGNLDEDSLLELYIDKVSENIEVTLPRMSENEMSDLSAAFDKYFDLITKAIDVVFNDDIYTEDNTPGVPDNIKAIKPMLISMFMRKWAAENNYLPEFFGMFGEDSIEDMIESIKTQIGASYELVIKTIKTLEAIKKEGGEDVKRLEADANGESDSSSGGGW